MDYSDHIALPLLKPFRLRHLCSSALALFWIATFELSAAELRVQVTEQGAGPLSAVTVCLGRRRTPLNSVPSAQR